MLTLFSRRARNGSLTSVLQSRFDIAELLIPTFFRKYKVKASLKLMCSECRFVKRKGKLRVVCSKKPRHKQRQG